MENVKIALRVTSEGHETFRFVGEGIKTDSQIGFVDAQGDHYEFQLDNAEVRMRKSGVSPLILTFAEGRTTEGELRTDGMGVKLSVTTIKLIIRRFGFEAEYRLIDDLTDTMTHRMVLKWDGRTRDND
jgi:hypothetical protein